MCLIATFLAADILQDIIELLLLEDIRRKIATLEAAVAGSSSCFP